MRDGEDDGREEGRKWTRPGIKSSGVAVAWMTPTCRMSWLKSCPLYSHPIPQKNKESARSLPASSCHITFHPKDLGTYRRKDISPRQISYAKPTRVGAARSLFQTSLDTPRLPTNIQFSSGHSLLPRRGFV